VQFIPTTLIGISTRLQYSSQIVEHKIKDDSPLHVINLESHPPHINLESHIPPLNTESPLSPLLIHISNYDDEDGDIPDNFILY
jgi:hypothetical protein